MTANNDKLFTEKLQLVEAKGFKHIRSGDPNQLKAALNVGPVNIVMAGHNPIFQHYKSGIIDQKKCGWDARHAVVAVGYGYDKLFDQDYVIIKNSWGNFWGMRGYAKVSLSQKHSRYGPCSVMLRPTLVQLAKTGKSDYDIENFSRIED